MSRDRWPHLLGVSTGVMLTLEAGLGQPVGEGSGSGDSVVDEQSADRAAGLVAVAHLAIIAPLVTASTSASPEYHERGVFFEIARGVQDAPVGWC